MMLTVGEAIRRARRVAGLKQAELGAKIGLSQCQVSRFEADAVSPTVAQLQQIAAALDVLASELLPAATP